MTTREGIYPDPSLPVEGSNTKGTGALYQERDRSEFNAAQFPDGSIPDGRLGLNLGWASWYCAISPTGSDSLHIQRPMWAIRRGLTWDQIMATRWD